MKKRKIILALAIFMMTGLLFSCIESNIGTVRSDDSILTENVMATAAEQQFRRESPEKIYKDFQEMLSKLESMNRTEIDTMSDEEVLELGKPFLNAFENTVKFDRETLERLSEATRVMNENPKSITKKMHSETVKEVEDILSSSASKFEKRTFDTKGLRGHLTNITGTRDIIEDVFECSEFFNVQGTNVYLYHGDVFGLANVICPAGSTFNIIIGTHYGHMIGDSKNGNIWIGLMAVLDGGGSTKRAFKDGMNNNVISWLTIRNYSQNGIVSDGSDNVSISWMTFKNIAPSYDGETNGAINFEDSQYIFVRYNEFENVAAGVLFTDSEGPL
ncbi:hypothetical protein [Rhodohalobacter sp. 614A]|uniref:hypothetical protein n=1 Tax=Rhodohalobacter sp. 614A TaxID=2908649 RepID=UPI001F386678|nr:hypothetical protein [Rhodohalobacter sp. 614A]